MLQSTIFAHFISKNPDALSRGLFEAFLDGFEDSNAGEGQQAQLQFASLRQRTITQVNRKGTTIRIGFLSVLPVGRVSRKGYYILLMQGGPSPHTPQVGPNLLLTNRDMTHLVELRIWDVFSI